MWSCEKKDDFEFEHRSCTALLVCRRRLRCFTIEAPAWRLKLKRKNQFAGLAIVQCLLLAFSSTQSVFKASCQLKRWSCKGASVLSPLSLLSPSSATTVTMGNVMPCGGSSDGSEDGGKSSTMFSTLQCSISLFCQGNSRRGSDNRNSILHHVNKSEDMSKLLSNQVRNLRVSHIFW